MSAYQRSSRFSFRSQQKVPNEEIQKEKSGNAILFRKAGLICVVLAICLVVLVGWFRTTGGSDHALETVHKKGSNGVSSYELYPFLVDSEAVATSVAKSKSKSTSDAAVIAVLSKPTLPSFPVIPRLEECQLVYKPSEPPRSAEDWRLKFWIASFPGSGASNPTMKGNLLREITERLFFGADESSKKPVKDYHMSSKKLRRCKGISETIGCSTTHPLTPVGPEGQTNEFRPEVIFSIRNPATAFPIWLTYKHIKYHEGTKQLDEDEWRKMRDQYFEESFQGWINQIRVWRAAEDSSYYFTSIYVPFEDLVTTNAFRGVAIIRDLSDAISGRKAFETEDKTRPFFETTTEELDYECIWYRKAKSEWEREQSIIGDYIPAYTQAFKDLMVRDLRAFADEVEKLPIQRDSDAVLVSLLRRYAQQIEEYLRVEEP